MATTRASRSCCSSCCSPQLATDLWHCKCHINYKRQHQNAVKDYHEDSTRVVSRRKGFSLAHCSTAWRLVLPSWHFVFISCSGWKCGREERSLAATSSSSSSSTTQRYSSSSSSSTLPSSSSSYIAININLATKIGFLIAKHTLTHTPTHTPPHTHTRTA